MTRWVTVIVGALLAVLLWSERASAHAFRPAVLTIRAQDDGRFAYRFVPPLDERRAPITHVVPRFASHCTATGALIDCRGEGLRRIEFEGLQQHPVDVVVRVVWLDGTEHHTMLRGNRHVAVIPDRMPGAGAGAVVAAYTRLGLEHIADGRDHLLFVLGLTALVGLRRKLLWTITGFTLAHSITLGLSALAGLSLPSNAVEVAIALSIVLLAVEIVDDRQSLSRRMPVLVAFGFGLLHGMGFAGALREIGLPAGRATSALLGFNVGVELGQVAVVAIAAGVVWAWRRWGVGDSRRLVVTGAYIGGAVGVAWAFERTLG